MFLFCNNVDLKQNARNTERPSEFSVRTNRYNKFASKVILINHQITYDTLMKWRIGPRCLDFETAGRQCPVFLDWCDRWSIWSNQLIWATFILIAPKEVELANFRILPHRYQPISICRNCILWPESTVQTHKKLNSQFFVARALVANYIVGFFSNAILKYFFNILEDLILSWGRYIPRDTTKGEYVV